MNIYLEILCDSGSFSCINGMELINLLFIKNVDYFIRICKKGLTQSQETRRIWSHESYKAWILFQKLLLAQFTRSACTQVVMCTQLSSKVQLRSSTVDNTEFKSLAGNVPET